jgi:DNA-binding transcriptional ArsR family regulator
MSGTHQRRGERAQQPRRGASDRARLQGWRPSLLRVIGKGLKAGVLEEGMGWRQPGLRRSVDAAGPNHAVEEDVKHRLAPRASEGPGMLVEPPLVTPERFDYDRTMEVPPSFVSLAALLGEPARANMLSALKDGRALTALELACCARVTPQTASSHLAKLCEGGLISVERSGRYRYFRLASPALADMLEELSVMAPLRHLPERRRSEALMRLRDARLCYDHVAGWLGVGLSECLVRQGCLEPVAQDYRLTDSSPVAPPRRMLPPMRRRVALLEERGLRLWPMLGSGSPSRGLSNMPRRSLRTPSTATSCVRSPGRISRSWAFRRWDTASGCWRR